MAELADALDLGSSGKTVQVRFLSRPPNQLKYPPKFYLNKVRMIGGFFLDFWANLNFKKTENEYLMDLNIK